MKITLDDAENGMIAQLTLNKGEDTKMRVTVPSLVAPDRMRLRQNLQEVLEKNSSMCLDTEAERLLLLGRLMEVIP